MTDTGELTTETARALIRLAATEDEQALNELTQLSRRRSYHKGEAIYRQDDPVLGLYAVLEGQVRIEIESPAGRNMIINWIGPNAVFGLLSFVGGSPQLETATAIEDSEILIFRRDGLLAYMADHPESMLGLTRILAERWQHARELLQDVVFLDVPGRLAKLLLHLSERHEVWVPGSGNLIKLPSQNDLALRVGSSRVTVNKWLQVFAHQGWIELHRNNVRIMQPERLRERIG